MIAVFFALLLVCSTALAAKGKEKPTHTPPPAEITSEIVEPPEQIQRLLEIVYNEMDFFYFFFKVVFYNNYLIHKYLLQTTLLFF